MQPQDILFEMGAKKVFICFGLNDVGLFSIEEHLKNYTLLIRRIQMKCPGIQIIILPTTPLTVEGEKSNLYNSKIDEYNNAVIKFANENGCYFVDIAQVLKDENGYLSDKLSSDNYCHLQDEAYDLWLDYLRTHAIPKPGEEKTDLETSVSKFDLKAPPEVEGWEGPAGEA
jgi:lysophospholipase L1-like esterase